MKEHLWRAVRLACLGAGASLAAAAAVHADVTVEQKTTLDVASLIRTHGSSTTSIAGDKKREDTQSHCEGMMSLVCGKVRSGEIVRLDRGLTWHLEPEKKSYREEVFATPEELAQMRAKMQARLEKMQSCPVAPQTQQPIDKSKCEMSPPKIDVHKTADRMSIAGHDALRTLASLTETCTNKETGDVCDTVVAFDVWLTQDNLPGSEDRRAFGQAYAKKMGFVDEQGALRGDFARFLAPYQTQIKQLTDKSSDFKGTPLKTSLRVMMGGPQCGAVKKANASATTPDSPPAGNPMTNVAQAGRAIGSSAVNLVGGLFHRKKSDDSQTPATGAPAPDSATTSGAPPGVAPPAAVPDPYAQFLQLASFTAETLAISTDAVPGERFDVPKDWKKEVPRASKPGEDDFTCPKTGS